MVSNISFCSFFTPEKINRKQEKILNPEFNIEGLKGDAERGKYFSYSPAETIGRSQVTKLSKTDKNFISKLNADKYGFFENGNDFWVHSYKPEDGKSKLIRMGHGKIDSHMSRQDFAKKVIDNKTLAFQVVGKNNLVGNKLITVIRNTETNKTTLYSWNSKLYSQDVIEDKIEMEKIASTILNNMTSIQGFTVWKE